MDFTKLMPNYFKDRQAAAGVELTEEEETAARREYHRLHAPRHGPVGRVRFMTNGQARRAQERWTKTRARKANKSYRRRWMANEQAFQRLRGQLVLIDTKPESPLTPGVIRVLEESYGSLQDAREHLHLLIQERIQNAHRARPQQDTDTEYKRSVSA